MAGELNITGVLSFLKSDFNIEDLSVVGKAVDVASANYVARAFTTSTADTAIPLGGLAAPFGYAIFLNADPTATIEIKTAVAGTVILKLLPGEFALLRLGSGISAPSCIASAGTPVLKYLILQP